MRQKNNLLTEVLKNSTGLLARIQAQTASLEKAAFTLTEYIEGEKARQHALLEKAASFSASLDSSGTALMESAKALHEKVSSSCASLEIVENSERALKDMNENFGAVVQRDYCEKTGQLNRVIDSINTLAFQCSHFQTLPKPYNDIICLYNRKIETMLEKKEIQAKLALQVIYGPDPKQEQYAVSERINDSDIEEKHKETVAALESAISQKNVTIELLENDINIAKQKNTFITGILCASMAITIIAIVWMGSLKSNSKLPGSISAPVQPNIEADLQALNSEKSNLEMSLASLEAEKTDLEADKSRLTSERDRWRNNYNNSKKVWLVNITDMKVGNYANSWINRPGERLNASDIRSLRPVFTYNSLVNTSMLYNIKIIKPNGSIIKYNDLTDNYSWSEVFQIQRTAKADLDIGSFPGTYSAGTYTIELWLDGFCLYSGKVKLN